MPDAMRQPVFRFLHPQDGPLGLDDEQIGRYAAMFADPEAPCRLPDGKTFMIPVHPIG